MIVKDEAPVIARCLASARPLVDHWIIVDTGSTDGTQAVVREFMAGVPGELVERPWVDFGHNRSEALALARPLADYSLVIDADDVFEVPPDFAMPVLKADSYTIDIGYGAIRYRRPQMVRNALKWQYRGVLHEFLECPEAKTSGHLQFRMRINHEGRRSTQSDTYAKDAAVLVEALETEKDPFLIARYTFYLGQSYRDYGRAQESLDAYLKRAEMGYWQEEVYVSLYEAGRALEKLARPPDDVLAMYARASAANPNRAEAAHAASRLCRGLGRNAQGAEVAEPALALPVPEGGLFVEPWIYEYGLRDEFAINAYWAKRYAESLEHTLAALASDKLPAGQQARFVANARLAFDRMTKGEPRWPADAPIPPRSRSLYTRSLGRAPRVLVAILTKEKAAGLPLFLARLADFDYPKDSLVLYVRANKTTDVASGILGDWLTANGHLYAGVEFDNSDMPVPESKKTRGIRNQALTKTATHGCDFFLSIEVDNFVVSCTLRELVALDLPIVAPLIRHARDGGRYANYHAKIDPNGYFQETPRYDEMLERRITGLFELPVVNGTYLVRADVIPQLSYEDGSERIEYVVFSDTARRSGIPQYLDNRQLYGYLTLDDDSPDIVADQLRILGDWFANDPSTTANPY